MASQSRTIGARIATLLTVIVLLLAGCGGDEDATVQAGDETVDDGTSTSDDDPNGSDGDEDGDSGMEDGASVDEGEPRVVDRADLVGTSWVLRFGGGPNGDVALVADHPITISFEDETFGGTAACNGYGGTYRIDGSMMIITDLSWTEMGCAPDVQASEQAYLAGLNDTDGIDLFDGLLTLSGLATELIFVPDAPAPTADLVGPRWLLDTIIDGDTVSTVLGEPASLEFADDSTFAGGTGCRAFSGRYSVNGNSILFEDFAMDTQECPADLADQDRHVVGVLGDGFTAEVDGERLTLTTNGGRGLSYRLDG